MFTFRTCNHKLLIETGRWSNIEICHKICLLFNKNTLDDEYDYVMEFQALTLFYKKLIEEICSSNVNTHKFENHMKIIDIDSLSMDH